MGITDWASDAFETAKETIGSNPYVWGVNQAASRVPEELIPWTMVPATVAMEALDQVAGDGFIWNMTPADLLPNIADSAWGVGEWGWDHRGGIDKMLDIVGLLQRMLTNKTFWLLLSAILVLWAVTPLLRFSYKATERPRAMAHTANRALHRGVRENAKHGFKRWVDPPQSKPRQGLSIPKMWKDKYHTGTYAVVEYRNPAPPLAPRAIGVRAYERSAANRCLRRHCGAGTWLLQQAQSLPNGVTVYHYVRR